MVDRFRKIVSMVCGEDWSEDHQSADDRDGAYGVAMVYAFINGCPPVLTDLSKTIGVDPYFLDLPFKRLSMNNVFRNHSWVLSDINLLMANSNNYIDKDAMIRSYAHIAALASGYIGNGRLREEMKNSFAMKG